MKTAAGLTRETLDVVDLINRIDRALGAGGVNAAEFERCAVALLQDLFPGLSAVEGGHDFGRDGDIYFPIDSEGSPSRNGRLLATTGDPRHNVRTGLSRMREEGLSADVLVLATSRKLSATVRRSLEQLAADYGVQTVQCFSRSWFVNRLFREPVWRQKLLPQVSGEIRALAARPSTLMEQAVPDGQLVGRAEELRRISGLLDEGQDVVLVGPPGVGKTRICAELGEGVMFVESTDEARLLDDVRELEPRVVVIDDADTRLEVLKLLRRARQDDSLRFALVGITWPDRVDRLRELVPDATVLKVPLLERAEIDAIIQAQGVGGYRARHVVLAQAQGRPGWALSLSAALLRGEGSEVLSGVVLSRQVQSVVERSMGTSPKVMDALSCLGALKHVGDHDCPRLAAHVGHTAAELGRLLHQSATNGLVDRVNEGWAIAPTLDSPLVASWFFGEPPVGSWLALREAFPDRTPDLHRAMVSAARAGAPAALRAADQWAHMLPDPVQWDHGTWSLVHAYAALGRDRSVWATRAAKEVLSSNRPTEAVLGVAIDLAGDAARRQLQYSMQGYLLPAATTGLLDLAVGDDRPRNSNPDHPLRIIADTAQRYHPDHGTAPQARQAILHAALRWLREAPAGERWNVVSETIAAALSPQVSGTWPQPDDPATLSIMRGIDSPRHLAAVVSLWTAEVAPVLAAAPAGEVPDTAVAHLLGLAEEMLRIGARRTPENVSEDQAVAAAEGGDVILEGIRRHVSAVPGLALRAQRVLDETSRTDIAAFEQDPQLLLLAGARDIAAFDGVTAWEADRQAKATQLAHQLHQLGPDAAVRRYLELVRQIELAQRDDRPTALPNALLDIAEDPIPWAAAASVHGAVMILRSAILRMVQDPNAPEMPPDLMEAAVADSTVRSTAIMAALFSPKLTPAVEIAVDKMTGADGWMLDQAMLFHKDADPVVWRLLNHPIQVLRSTTAVLFAVGTSHGPPLPVGWKDQWQDALLDARADDLDQHAQWRLGQLLLHLVEADPDLAERWYSRRFSEMGYVTSPEPHGVEEHLRSLPRSHRQRLAKLCAGRPRIGQSLLTYLVNSDVELAEKLLDESIITANDLCEALLGQRGELFESIAPLAYARGADPEHLATAADSTGGWSFSDSSECEDVLEYLKRLSHHENTALREIAQAGIRQQEERLHRLRDQEHRRRVRGQW